MQRNSILNERHIQLGSTLEGDTWNNMRMAWHYHTDGNEEVIATRTRAALYDVSGVNIVHVSGPDAEVVLDRMLTIDMTKLKPGTARLAGEVNEAGALIDDIMVMRDAPDRFRLSHGSGATPQVLAEVSAGKNVTVESDQDVHALSLQGPLALSVLKPHVTTALADLPYFSHVPTTLFGKPVILARGGYSGERGYEAYCASKDAVFLWDSILEVGKPHGVMAASWNTLDLTRIEAALLFFPFEMPEGDTTPWEVNMHWAVDLDKKADFIGRAALTMLKGRERCKQAGMIVHSASAVKAGSPIFQGSKQVGVVTTAAYSNFLMQSLAMVHLHPSCVALGTSLVIRDGGADLDATVVRTPFYDPLRLRTHPEKLRA
jgi:aminomethyltransferase